MPSIDLKRHMEEDQAYVGRNYDEVSKELFREKIMHRRTRINGNSMLVTQDLRLDRLNFEVEKDIITSVHRG